MNLPDDLVQVAAAAIADAKYPGVKGAPGARPFTPRPYDVRYGGAAAVAILRALHAAGYELRWCNAEIGKYQYNSAQRWADALEAEAS